MCANPVLICYLDVGDRSASCSNEYCVHRGISDVSRSITRRGAYISDVVQEALIAVSSFIWPYYADGRTRVSDGVLGIGIKDVIYLSGRFSWRNWYIMANILKG